jgi:hypothetical protein
MPLFHGNVRLFHPGMLGLFNNFRPQYYKSYFNIVIFGIFRNVTSGIVCMYIYINILFLSPHAIPLADRIFIAVTITISDEDVL